MAGHYSLFRRSSRYYGQNSLGVLLAGVIVCLLVLALTVYLFMNVTGTNEDGVFYNEVKMQDYAQVKYAKYFGSSSAAEDNLLIVFLSNQEGDGYYTVAWIGDNIDYEINAMFDEYAEYGEAMDKYINRDYFGDSLAEKYALVIKEMTQNIMALGLSSSFISESDRSALTQPKFVNLTQFDLSYEAVNPALEYFTEQTGIPCVLVADYAENVFASANTVNPVPESAVGMSGFTVAGIIIVAVIFVVAVAVIGYLNKNSKTKKKEEKLPWEG